MKRNEAASEKHQSIDGPPRQNLSRCGTNYTAAEGKKQSQTETKKIVDIKRGEYMNSVALVSDNAVVANHFSAKQIDILKNSICKGVSNEEFEVFLMACQKTQLDPFMRQIYAVKRRARKPDGTFGETMTIQTGIDGYRLIAERTERYAPGPEPTYSYDQKGNLSSATAYIKKQTKDGTWHTVSASAHIDEYCQRTKEGNPMGMWASMPRTMLSKCAEAQALRKAFPAEMSGVYTKEEMQQADIDVTPKMSLEQASEIEMILDECDEAYRKWVYDFIQKQYKASCLSEVPSDLYMRMRDAAKKNMDINHEKQRSNQELIAVEV